MRGLFPSPLRTLLFLFAAAALASGTGCGNQAALPDRAGSTAPTEPAAWKAETSFDGTILFQSDADGDDEIYALTRDGVRKLTDNAWSDVYPRWSPDGGRIAFAANPKGNFDIFAMNPDGTGIAALVGTSADETEPDWRPDGSGIAFTRGDEVAWAIDFVTRAEKRLVPDFSRTHGILDFSPSAPLATFTGKRLLGWDVFALDLGTGRSTPLTSGGKSCRGRFSPDGRTIAFVSHVADGWGDIWTMKPDGAAKTRLTTTGGQADYFPSWSPDGKEIVFCSGTAHSPKEGRWTLHILDVATGRVRPLFSGAERALFPDWR
jgi:Tol biopolymer transport system component